MIAQLAEDPALVGYLIFALFMLLGSLLMVCLLTGAEPYRPDDQPENPDESEK